MDTLETKKTLKKAFTDEQAEVLVEVLKDLVTHAELRKELDGLRQEIQSEMRKQTIRIMLGNAAIMAAFLALYDFAN